METLQFDVNTEMLPGLSARVQLSLAEFSTAIVDEHEANVQSWEAGNFAFSAGAIRSELDYVPYLLAGDNYLAEAFRSGQVQRENEFGFACNGRWYWHEQRCFRCGSLEAKRSICGPCKPLASAEVTEAVFAVVDECWNDYSLLDED